MSLRLAVEGDGEVLYGEEVPSSAPAELEAC
jgi:hypothetical protein